MSKEKQPSHETETNERNYEQSDARLRTIVLSGVVLAAIMIAAMLAMKGVFSFFEGQRFQRQVSTSPLAAERELPPEPRLQVTPETDLERADARVDSVLNSYGWVVREAGVVRIPIERAMELALKRGFPERPQEQNSRNADRGAKR